MHSTYNEGKSVVAERFVRTLKNKIFKHMTAVSKNVYFDVLDDIVNKYNNTVHKSIKMKPIDVTFDSYAEYNEDSNVTKPKFNVDYHVRISKYKNIFAKRYTQNWSEEVFDVSKIKDTVPWTYVISDLNDEKIVGSFYEKELQKTIQEKCRIEKLLKRKGGRLYVKWKGYDDSFNSCIVVKKAVYDKLVAKVNNIGTSDFVLKTKYQTDKTELEKKILDLTDFIKKTKFTELEDKISDVSSLARKTALTAVENTIPSVSNLVKKNRLWHKNY